MTYLFNIYELSKSLASIPYNCPISGASIPANLIILPFSITKVSPSNTLTTLSVGLQENKNKE